MNKVLVMRWKSGLKSILLRSHCTITIALEITESLLSLLDTTCIVVTCVAGNNRLGHV